jgi:rhodanese-related sulfurtransferase
LPAVVIPRVLALPLRTTLILGAGALTGWVLNGIRAEGVQPAQFQAAVSCGAPAADSTIGLLSPEHAQHLCGAPGVLVADVRPADRFERGHVVGAIHLPCAASGDVLGRALGAAAGKHTLVVYGENTAEAQTVATSLQQKLHRPDLKITVLEGGFAAWDAQGLACSSGPCPDCGVQARDRAGGAP